MQKKLYQLNKLIFLFLILGIVGGIYGIVYFFEQGREIVETGYQVQQSSLQENTNFEQFEEFFTSYQSQSPTGAEIILSGEIQGVNIFTHLEDLAQTYGVLTQDFEIAIPENQPIPHQETTVLTFGFLGSRFGIQEYIKRIEEATPLMTIRDLDLTFDQSGATKGSIALEIYQFIYDPNQAIIPSLTGDSDPLQHIPEALPSYPYLYDITQKTPSTSGFFETPSEA